MNHNYTAKIVYIQQGSAWKKMCWPTDPSEAHAINLLFSLFINWFNPQGNKISGKQQSLGLIALNCLDLPHPKRHLICHTYIAGITPGPNALTTNTINH